VVKMGFFDFLNPALDFSLGWILILPPFWGILLITIIISVIITLVYKYTTDQGLMKSLKTEMKELQKQMKELKENPEEVKKIQSKFMSLNGKYTMESFKPSLYYLIPLLLIFGWLSSNMGYEPLLPGQEFNVALQFEKNITGNVSVEVVKGIEVVGLNVKEINNGLIDFNFKGEKGNYLLEFKHREKSYKKEVLITNERKFKTPISLIEDGSLKQIIANNKETIVLNLFGWELGWLGTYILLSIVFSMGLRKVLDVY
jgi:uncharacterized membrane protein (DUF106 family)